ncbi:MAG: hypothetical protein WBM07_13450, partial [Chitinivibrionales bacterium]
MPINNQQIQKLKNEPNEHYDDWASWAIWDPKEDNHDFQHNIEAFCNPYTNKRLCWAQKEIETNPQNLLNEIVILGLNISTKCEKWSNFHLTQERAGRNPQHDRKLRFLFDKSQYRGAYMTDLFKTETKESDKVLKLAKNEIWRNSHFNNLQNELKVIG